MMHFLEQPAFRFHLFGHKFTPIRAIVVFFALWVVTVALGLTPWIYSDGAGDYSWVRSFFMDGDLNCANEFAHFVTEFERDYGWPGPSDDLFPARTKTGYQANKYPIGTAILWSPFFLLGHLTTLTENFVFGTHILTDGYSKWYVFFVTLGSNFYAFLGILIAFGLARKLFSVMDSFWATMGIWFASSIPVYMYLYPSMPHNTALFMVALYYWYWHKSGKNRTMREWAVLGFLAGFMILTRMETAVLLILPFFEIVQTFWRVFRSSEKNLGTYLVSYSVFVLFIIVGFGLQMIVWKMVFGHYFLNPYNEMSKLVSAAKIKMYGFLPNADVIPKHKSTLAAFLGFFLYPHLNETLFGTSYGIYFWTPILLLATVGYIFLIRRDKRTGWSSLIAAFLLIYVTSHARKAGMSFGDRFLIKASIFFILGLTALFSAIRPKIRQAGLIVLVAFLITWNALLILQYSTGLVNRNGPVDWKKMVSNQFTKAPGTLLVKLKPFLIGRNAAYRSNSPPKK